MTCDYESFDEEYAVYYCCEASGHDGPHRCTTTRGFTPEEMGDDPDEVNGRTPRPTPTRHQEEA